MKIEGSRALVTGAGRGLGKALTSALIERGAAHVYPAARDIDRLRSVYGGEPRATALELDITSDAAIARAVDLAGDVDIVINNAAIIHHAPVLAAESLENARAEMETNYWGLVGMCRHFAPILKARKEAAFINVLSVASIGNIPLSGTYCPTKAAALSATQCIRAELAETGVQVLAVFPGPIDSEMATGEDRTGRHAPSLLANNILDALEQGQTRLYPDPTSAEWGRMYDADPWALEALFATFKPQPA